MKTYEIKSIGAGSVFKFNLCWGFVIGLIVGLALLLMGHTLNDVGIELGTIRGALGVGTGIVGIVLASALQGIGAGIAGAIMAFFYNIFAAAVGGIKVKMEEG